MKQTTTHPVAKAFTYLILLFWTACVLYPVIWTIFGSLKNNEQFLLGKPWDLPAFPWFWSNFSYVWEQYNLGSYFINSLMITVGSTMLALALSAMTSYVIARFVFRGGQALYNLYVSSMMIPMILGLVPLFFLLDDLHLINTMWGLIFVYTASSLPFGIFVLTGFFKALPKEMEESAEIDGATHSTTFFKVMLPLVKPGLISVGMMNVLNIWNEYILGTVLVNDPEKYTLPVGIAVMQAEMQYRTEWGPLFAGLLVSMIPVLLLYIIFQRQITGGITAGAVK